MKVFRSEHQEAENYSKDNEMQAVVILEKDIDLNNMHYYVHENYQPSKLVKDTRCTETEILFL